jgi:flagellar biosynthesis regulator FlaF
MFFKQLLDKARSRRAPAPDPTALAEAARNALDVAARRDACRALVQLDVLWERATEDTDPGVRDLASARYRRLLCGLDEQAPDLAERSSTLAGIEDQALLAHVAREAVEPELRRTAIQRLADPAQLAACAIGDPLAANRQAAAERLQDRTALELVQRRSAKRDKTVYRLVKERLRTLAEADERPRRLRAQADAICEKLARLGRFDNWTQDQALLQLLDREWAALETEADSLLPAEHRERRARLRADFVAGYEAYAQEHAEQLAAAETQAAAATRRHALVRALAECAALNDLDALTAKLDEIERDWQAIDPGTADPAVRRAYADALAAARAHCDRLTGRRRREQDAASVARDAEEALATGNLDHRRVRALEQRLAKLDDDGAVPAATKNAVAKLGTRLKKHREQLRPKLAALPERLAELDRHFADGHLRQAEPLYQSIRATLDQARSAGLPAADTADAEAHLKGIAPQLKELQRWRRWGANTRRQALCEEIERLAADAEHALEPLANRLAELQDDWRALDRNGAPADDALWQRFRTAAEFIRTRCKPFYEAQAKIQAANREQRLALCEQLEQFLEQVDWERMDWKKAMRAEREMRRAWIALGPESLPAGRRRRGERPLESRFRKSLRRLDEALNTERERNRAERRDLIAQMKQLAEDPDLRGAIESAKALQRRWHPTVTGRQRDENALWQEFRAAADAVFARRDAEHQARSAELEANLTTREALCTALADAARQARDADKLQRSLREHRQQWRDTEALQVPRTKLQALQRRWQESLEIAEDKLAALAREAEQAALEAVAQRARWCDETARSLVTGGVRVADAATLRDAWEALPAIDEPALRARVDAAASLILAAAEGDQEALAKLAARLPQAEQTRRALCLQLEIAAGVASPPELESARMALQVQRLQARMGDGSDQQTSADTVHPFQLLRQWYEAVPAAAAPDLDARYTRVREALGV